MKHRNDLAASADSFRCVFNEPTAPNHKRMMCIVVGGGHTGCGQRRFSLKVLTYRIDLLDTHKIGVMSTIHRWWLGKTSLIREVGTFDGLMGKTWWAGIQFRMLNLAQGPRSEGPHPNRPAVSAYCSGYREQDNLRYSLPAGFMIWRSITARSVASSGGWNALCVQRRCSDHRHLSPGSFTLAAEK